MENLLQELSSQTAALVVRVKASVICVGPGKVRRRSGLAIGDGEVVTLSRRAEAGEHVLVVVDGEETDATVIGYDGTSGIALLTVDGLTAQAALSATLPAVGDLAVTVAYPIPEGHEARLEMVRCVGDPTRLPDGRRIDAYLQTDSARFRGFAGSVLFNAAGEALGITIPRRGPEESFLIPMSDVATIVEQIRSGKGVGTGYLGVQTMAVDLPQPADGHTTGLLITGVEENSAAERARLKVGSFIVAVGGETDSGAGGALRRAHRPPEGRVNRRHDRHVRRNDPRDSRGGETSNMTRIAVFSRSDQFHRDLAGDGKLSTHCRVAGQYC
jgi:S1-C subfamily serine protease